MTWCQRVSSCQPVGTRDANQSYEGKNPACSSGLHITMAGAPTGKADRPEPGDRARLQADVARGNTDAARALQVLCCRRAPRAVQIDQKIRRRGGPRAARLSAVGTAPALSEGVH